MDTTLKLSKLSYTFFLQFVKVLILDIKGGNDSAT